MKPWTQPPVGKLQNPPPMLDGITGWVGRGLRGLWRATLGRFFGRPAERQEPQATVRPPEEPQSVAGITLRATLVVLGIGLLIVLAYQLRLLLILAFLATLFAAGLHGPSRLVEARGLPRVPSVVLTYAVLIGVLALVVFLIFPPLINQAVDLVDSLPELVDELNQRFSAIVDQVAGAGTAERVINAVTQGAQDALPQLGSLLQVPLTVIGILVNIVLILFLSALLLLERDAIKQWSFQFIDPEDRVAVEEVADRALGKLGAYVRGQLVLMTMIGVGSGLGMLVVGLFVNGEPLPFIFPLSLLAFITEAIPMVGPFISGVPIVLVAFLVDPLAGLLILVWFVALQQLEGLVMIPIVQSRAVSLSPLIVLLAVLAGGSLAGVVGAIIAIPVVAVIDVVLRDVVIPLRRRSQERRTDQAVATVQENHG